MSNRTLTRDLLLSNSDIILPKSCAADLGSIYLWGNKDFSLIDIFSEEDITSSLDDIV